MPIGSSIGAFHEDEFRYEAAPWFIDPKMEEKDNNVVTPKDVQRNQTLEKIELNPATSLDGLEVAMKNQMPFPDNRNKEAEFESRFGNLPPSGILNDLKKPSGETVPLVRKISDKAEVPIQIEGILEGHNQGKLTLQEAHKALNAEGWKGDFRSKNWIQVWGPDGKVIYY